jgi:hypothetical protein
MITNTGKSILGKYLIGQAPSYASYIAIGVGATPLSTEDDFGNYSNKTSLDFEAFRVPVISKGYVNEDGQDKVVLTAELPTENRYEITEIGIYSAGSNPEAVGRDSRTMFSFVQSENWEYHTSTSATTIPVVYSPLDPDNDNVIVQASPVFQTNADNRTFTNQQRQARYENCRILNNIIAIRGDTSTIEQTQNGLSIVGQNHIHLNGVSINLDKNSGSDEVRFAFSVINKDGNSNAVPEKVLIVLEADSEDESGSGQSIKFEVELENGTAGHDQNEHDFATNRYVVISKQLQDLSRTSGFAWNLVNIIKVYATVIYNDEPSDLFYICLDGIRLENTTDTNPLYGLTGYSVVKNSDALPIVKRENTSNFVEFRFAIGVS